VNATSATNHHQRQAKPYFVLIRYAYGRLFAYLKSVK